MVKKKVFADGAQVRTKLVFLISRVGSNPFNNDVAKAP